MALKVSYGCNAYDCRWINGKKQHEPILTVECPWAELLALLTDAAHIERVPATKDLTPWVAPFILRPDTDRRRLDDVASMSSWIGLDLDLGNWSRGSISTVLADCKAIVYTTASSRADAQRWRILVKLDRAYSTDEHDRVWRYFNELFNRDLDRGCRNANRIFFVPAEWDGADNVMYTLAGEPCAIDTILAETPALETPTPSTAAALACGPLNTAPDGQPIVTRHMLEQAMNAAEGRRLFRLMCAAAKRFRRNGWNLTSDDLAQAGRDAANTFSPGKKRSNIDREAQRALAWAESNFSPMTKMEKIRNRILWEQQRNVVNRTEI